MDIEKTVSAMQSAVLAMVLNPSVLKRAQEEIDRVIGSGRLPSLEDRPLLPYIEGIVREANRCACTIENTKIHDSVTSYRWNPVVPTGQFHVNL